MNGFIAEAQKTAQHTHTDAMGYHDAREIPNYWSYARDFVLQDRMFEPDASWSVPSHLFTVSEWAAICSSSNPFSCTNDDNQGNFSETRGGSVGGELAQLIYPHLNQRNSRVGQASAGATRSRFRPSRSDFAFNPPPRKPIVASPHPKPGPASRP